MHIASFIKVIYWNQILFKNIYIYILYCCFYKVTLSMSKVNFLFFSFIETNRLNIDSFTIEN